MRGVETGRLGVAVTVTRLQWIALLGLCAGVWATWPLWTARQSFPQIPWVGVLIDVPAASDVWLLTTAGLAGCVALVTSRRGAAVAARLVFSAAVVGLLLLDQHRFQVWALHLLVVLWLLWLDPGTRGLLLVRVFVISIYVHSASSRFDRASLEMQWDLLAPLLDRIGVPTKFAGEPQRLWTGAVFVAWELGTAVLLAVPRTRRAGVCTSIAMHGMLLLLLGPLGHDHHAGVLVWNTVWIMQNVVLFWSRGIRGEGGVVAPHPGPLPRRSSSAGLTRLSGERGRTLIAWALALMVVLAPLLEPWGCWDHWPSWRVYSARPETVTFYVRESRVTGLPPEVQTIVGPPELLSDWRPLSLDTWSFAELRCPVYPQARFRLAVALALTRQWALGNDVRVVVGSSPEWWTGKRESQEYVGEQGIASASERFVVNVRERE
ncbi:MAG: hypothetical protein JNG89_20700 [Planctomycetaceae bacterium]|nr:hypothetical protein [Planctomycetaceae bacterium]